ncbi:MAG: dihydrodipicolinate synthase family protein [Deltaproteobacteria bacterium]|jgi:4-hydroxy-tetrahydrodipicolinate synthase|nr:dihydrodipicolinate synthase family protein [Deltaproteobacteria bacterium]
MAKLIRRKPSFFNHLKNDGVAGLVIMGSSGEFCNLDMIKSKKLIDIAASFDKGSLRVFSGASRMDPEESVALANYAFEKGLDEVMILSSYYFPLNQDAIFDFYSFIASKTPSKIFIYNFPAHTGHSVSPETTLKLVDKHNNIYGFKDSILDMGNNSDLIKIVKEIFPHFEVYSGFDNNFTHNILSEGNDCIGGLSNIIPDYFRLWMDSLAIWDMAQVSECQRHIDKRMDIYTISDNFIPVIKKPWYFVKLSAPIYACRLIITN